MKVNANAKINLTLDVCGKRDDGYHNVAMIMQEVSFCDVLDIELRTDGRIILSCDSKLLGNPESTLTYRAAKLFFDSCDTGGGCNITLHQNIPMCAGLGAGSADAAAVLNYLNCAYDNLYSQSKLCELGLMLGADVPFCIMGGTSLAEGIGEILTPLKSKMQKWVALIKPDINISTPDAYREMDSVTYPHPDIESAINAIENNDMALFSKSASNSFEYVISKKHSEISEIKKHLYDCGCEFAMMSGSGPTVFGLFENKESAENSLKTYKKSFSGGVGSFILK
ncbi:MAG: 4-(cytidine 5'-diphospho)-2-C-methyl-D-erythritol kinase [Clostridia bacterium]|nr:4-(cytidine 5'-diphospho)-2-C-methyl-D-erythritol kinase [Clostridia bacterium]